GPVPSKLFLVRELGQARCDPPQHLDGLVDPVVSARDKTAKKFVVLGLLGYAVDQGFCLAELGARFTNEPLDLPQLLLGGLVRSQSPDHGMRALDLSLSFSREAHRPVHHLVLCGHFFFQAEDGIRGFSGSRELFDDLPLFFEQNGFMPDVWKAAQSIPYGETRTY